MPIHNLTDVPKAFMRLGRIKKGDRNGKNGAPRDLDYFRVIFQESNISAPLEAKFREVYGDQPRAINVRFAANEPAEIWDANYECYRRGARIASAGVDENGPYWISYRDPETNEVLVRNRMPVGSAGAAFVAKPIDLAEPIYYAEKSKEPVYLHTHGRLQCVVPELTRIEVDGQPRAVVGFMEFAPKSPIDIRNISAELGMYHNLAKAAGRTINGIPFQLIRRLEDVSVKIDGKMSVKPMWVAHLDCAGEWGRYALEAVERLALPDGIRIEDVIDAEEDDEFNAPQAPAQRNGPMPAVADKPLMDFNKAKQITVTVFNPKTGKTVQKFCGELNLAQLDWVIANDADPDVREAAQVVLADRKAEAK